jgi:RNA polymerase sigma-70 factor (ECF subfamily)
LSQEQHADFLLLINQHRGILHKVVNLYVDEALEREDLIQEIQFQAYKSFERFRGESQFSTWLYRVSLNTVFSYRKKINRRKEAEQQSAAEPIQELPSDAAQELYFHIRQLEPIKRMIITLHLEGFGNQEIAAITGMNANVIGVRLHRIREVLTQKMNRHD